MKKGGAYFKVRRVIHKRFKIFSFKELPLLCMLLHIPELLVAISIFSLFLYLARIHSNLVTAWLVSSF